MPRSVKDAEFEIVETKLTGEYIKSDEFKAINPNGFIPVLKDDDFVLFEGNAIMVYVAEKFGWTDLYPTDPATRTKVNEVLHWHHTNTRLFATKIFRPTLYQRLGMPMTSEDHVNIEKTHETIDKVSELLEKFLVKDFIARTDTPTLVDYAAHCEFDQLELMGHDLSKFPKVHTWLARMKTLPHYDEVHEPVVGMFKTFGYDVSANL